MAAPSNDNRAPGAPAAPQGLAQRLVGLLSAKVASHSLPSLDLPKYKRIKPLVRSQWSAWWQAYLAVGAGVKLEDYLRFRLSHYVGELPVPQDELPLRVSVEQGKVVAVEAAAPLPAIQPAGALPPPASADAWIDALVQIEGPVAAQEIRTAKEDLDRITEQAAEQAGRVDGLLRDLDQAIASGAAAAPQVVEATPEQMGRPPVPSLGGVMAIYVFSALLLLAQAWQFAVPYLSAIGIDTLHLGAEVRRNPIGIVLGSVFALGAATSLFVFAHVALRRGLDLYRGEGATRHKLWIGFSMGGAALLASITAWLLGSLRPTAETAAQIFQGSDSVRTARFAFFLLALIVPLAVACLIQVAERLTAQREALLVAARAWDVERFRTLTERVRREELLERAERERVHLELERQAAQARLRTLHRRSVEARRGAAELAESRHVDLRNLAASLAAALETDRYEFVRQANARGMPTLLELEPPPAPVPEPRNQPRREAQVSSLAKA
ncbi:hypothetical protein AMPC_30730 [Anaeromyxobacter paludicola]|uniref:Uncharacterized protein n=1 Tax=Anaeromyxobacter paludicola TaxID=2918171 RepID=A0ABM7XDK3_9BACT|nr:hypothetical protein AMPC_30730 [Anaeromyxobacter paludicola]